MTLSLPLEAESLQQFYQDQLTDNFLPFWNRAVDRQYGGIFTCFSNSGAQLLSTNKFVWSQGRFVWTWAHLAEACQRGLLVAENAAQYLETARLGAEFLMQHALLDNGSAASWLTRTGVPFEANPGQGLDASFYSDCFVILGWAEYARVARDAHWLTQALDLWHRVRTRLAEGTAKSEPYPVSPGWTAHAHPMILLNTAHTLYEAARTLKADPAPVLLEQMHTYVDIILSRQAEGDLLPELRSNDPTDSDTLQARHLNPGHVIESMSFIVKALQVLPLSTPTPHLHQALRILQHALMVGWDPEYGGLLRYVDRDGGPPKGRLIGGAYEDLVQSSWDTKLWWPHVEALYATLLARTISGDLSWEAQYLRLHGYAFATFPQSDPQIREWIQIRDRQGYPVDAVAGLPVKDPFHILRSFLLIIELLTTWGFRG